MPPGTDDLPGKKPPERRPRRGGGRGPGKQPGAPGAYLAWREHPDKTEDVFPEGSCACAADLAGAADLRVRCSHQVSRLPGSCWNASMRVLTSAGLAPPVTATPLAASDSM